MDFAWLKKTFRTKRRCGVHSPTGTGRWVRFAARLVNPIALGSLAFGLSACALFDFGPPGPDDYPVKGIDVSYYQDDINWRSVVADNTAFAWLKATEGGDWYDPKFDANWYGAAMAGLPRGAYHFWYFCRPATEQVNWFLQHVPYDPYALPPVLDIEWVNSKNCPGHPSREAIIPEVRTWLDAIERYYGKRPIIYTSISFYNDRLRGAFPGYFVWIASYKGHPIVRDPSLRWNFWQHTHAGRVAGIRGRVDRNVFNGSVREWQAFLQGQLRPEG
ncbi:GH25 family lysozyme [Pleomorphomonas oryzae]|uniref:GH25 family lysozyme n=1 Tax=Pleomorphomonas oryzae TaxID=261934 RepID=UPI0003FFABD3|nr:GH25 family lysozyme [Pleomorphomonas oryzae]